MLETACDVIGWLLEDPFEQAGEVALERRQVLWVRTT
jgi:hypothetical protein